MANQWDLEGNSHPSMPQLHTLLLQDKASTKPIHLQDNLLLFSQDLQELLEVSQSCARWSILLFCLNERCPTINDSKIIFVIQNQGLAYFKMRNHVKI